MPMTGRLQMTSGGRQWQQLRAKGSSSLHKASWLAGGSWGGGNVCSAGGGLQDYTMREGDVAGGWCLWWLPLGRRQHGRAALGLGVGALKSGLRRVWWAGAPRAWLPPQVSRSCEQLLPHNLPTHQLRKRWPFSSLHSTWRCLRALQVHQTPAQG